MNDAARRLLDLMLEAGRRSIEIIGRSENAVGYLAGDRPLLTALFRYTERDFERINRLLGSMGRSVDADTVLVVPRSSSRSPSRSSNRPARPAGSGRSAAAPTA